MRKGAVAAFAETGEHGPARRASAMPPDERRRMIVEATLPLLLQNGEMISTRQIADAAGIAEGTIFRVFDDKDAVIAAVVERALDTGALEEALGDIDAALPLESALEEAVTAIQQRVVDIWRLFSSIGPRFHDRGRGPQDVSPALVALLRAHRRELCLAPDDAARWIRAVTLSVTHPLLATEPMSPAQIVHLVVHGVVKRAPCGPGGGAPARRETVSREERAC